MPMIKIHNVPRQTPSNCGAGMVPYLSQETKLTKAVVGGRGCLFHPFRVRHHP